MCEHAKPSVLGRSPPVASRHRQIGRDRGRDVGAKGSQRAVGQGAASCVSGHPGHSSEPTNAPKTLASSSAIVRFVSVEDPFLFGDL